MAAAPCGGIRRKGGAVALGLAGLGFPLLLLLGAQPRQTRLRPTVGRLLRGHPARRDGGGCSGWCLCWRWWRSAISGVRYWRAIRGGPMRPVPDRAWLAALRDAVTLRHLHGGGVDCVSGIEDAPAVAALVPSLHALRTCAVLRVHDGGGDLPRGVRMDGAARLPERAGGAGCGGWDWAGGRAAGAGCAAAERDPSLGEAQARATACFWLCCS